MAVDVSPVRDVEHKYDPRLLDDAIRTSPGAMTTFEWAEQRLADPLRVLRERTRTELENRRRDHLG
jgi:hypothetical protein